MRLFPTLAYAALSCGLMAAPALAEDLEFVLSNASGVSVVAFYVSHSGTNEWEENLMDGGYLPHGNEITVLIADGRDVCEYDIRAEFEDGDVLEDYDLDLCDMESYRFE